MDTCYLSCMPTAAQIVYARNQAGLTQEEAAELLGVGRVTWTRYELGTRSMTEAEWRYWKHVAGLERIPFRARKTAE